MESQQEDFRSLFIYQGLTITNQKHIVNLTKDIVDYVSSGCYNSTDGIISAHRFMDMLIKFMESLAKEENNERLYMLPRCTSWEQLMYEIERLMPKLTAAENILGNEIKMYLKDGEGYYEQRVFELKKDICLLKIMANHNRIENFTYIQETFQYIQMEMKRRWKDVQADNEEGMKLSENEGKHQENRANTGRFEEMANLQTSILKQTQQGMTKHTKADSFEDEKGFENGNKQLLRFRKKLDKFKKSLNEEEFEDTITFLETRKITWEKQMAKVNQLEYELTTVYFLGNEINKDFEDIEILYGTKLKELNRKINELKAEETQTLKNNLTHIIQTEMQQVTQIARKMSITGDKNQEKNIMGNIQLQRFRSKIAILQSNICNSNILCESLYYCESTKASFEKQMDQIEQLEQELATVYLLGDDICSEFEIMQSDYCSILRSLNSRIGAMRKRNKN